MAAKNINSPTNRNEDIQTLIEESYCNNNLTDKAVQPDNDYTSMDMKTETEI